MATQATQQNNLQDIFDQAVTTARVMYPTETQNVFFVNLDTEEGKASLKSFLEKEYEEAEGAYETFLGKESAFLYSTNDPNEKKILAHQESISFLKDPVKDIQFAFWHEMGHLLDPKTTKADSRMLIPINESLTHDIAKETMADTFSCLQGLKQKFMNEADVACIARKREKLAKKYDMWEYYTSPALTSLHKITDGIESLSPKDIQTIAQKHRDTYALNHEGLREAYMKLSQQKKAHTP